MPLPLVPRRIEISTLRRPLCLVTFHPLSQTIWPLTFACQMPIFVLTHAILWLLVSWVAAQRPCYWPDGTVPAPGKGNWVNCHMNQDSNCCLDNEMCLSNGLCFGAGIGMVRPQAT